MLAAICAAEVENSDDPLPSSRASVADHLFQARRIQKVWTGFKLTQMSRARGVNSPGFGSTWLNVAKDSLETFIWGTSVVPQWKGVVCFVKGGGLLSSTYL